MSALADLINLDLSDSSEKIIAEYIWSVKFFIGRCQIIFLFDLIYNSILFVYVFELAFVSIVLIHEVFL